MTYKQSDERVMITKKEREARNTNLVLLRRVALFVDRSKRGQQRCQGAFEHRRFLCKRFSSGVKETKIARKANEPPISPLTRISGRTGIRTGVNSLICLNVPFSERD
jgi:hypothetical protein